MCKYIIAGLINPARAPTRSLQGHRARQNAAKNPADLHAGRSACRRQAQARVGLAESRPAKVGTKAEASEFHPQPAKHAGGVTAVLSVERFSVFLPHQYFSR